MKYPKKESYSVVDMVHKCVLAANMSIKEAKESKESYSENFPDGHFEIILE